MAPSFAQNDTVKFLTFFLRVRRDPNDEIDHKIKICSTIRFFDMIPQSLSANVCFLNKSVIWIFEIFAIKHESALFLPNDTVKFSKFFLRVRQKPSDEIDHKRKICSTIRFFDMFPQSLNFSFFAISKLIKRPLPPKRHGEISLIFLQS